MRRVITFALLCAYWGSLPAAASAQTLQMPVTRGDASASIGWFGADRRLSGECCSGWSAGLFKGIAGGYYWTDNLKTEVELGWPGETEAYSYTSTPLPGSLSAFQYDEHTFTGLKLSAAQQYQFGRNQMFHPFVGGGVELDRQRDEIERRTETSRGGFTSTMFTDTVLIARPFVTTGFKAYFSERSFFRTEFKVAFREDGVEQIAWKGGVGVDFARRGAGARIASSDTATEIPPRVHEDPDLWRHYAAKLPIGRRVRVSTGEGRTFTGTLIAVGDEEVTVKPISRISEPVRRVRFEQLEWLAPDEGNTPNQRAGVIAAGIGTGVAVFYGMLFILFASVGD